MNRRTRFGHGLLAVVIWATGLTAVGSPARADAAAVRFEEYQVKAAFLYSFARFVEWPADHPFATTDEIRIGIVGRDPFGDALDRTLQGKTILGRKPEIRRYETPEQIEACHVLFIGNDQVAAMPQILERLDGAPVLTVGEWDGFVEDGGIIGFVVEQNRVRFEIDPEAAKRSGLKLSSKLLGVARIVR